jgi:hypothetical protein
MPNPATDLAAPWMLPWWGSARRRGQSGGAVDSKVQGPVAEYRFLIAGNRDPQKAQILRYGPRQSPTTAADRTWMFISFDEERSWS